GRYRKGTGTAWVDCLQYGWFGCTSKWECNSWRPTWGEFGHCVAAFTVNLGCCFITRAELRGIIVGLKVAREARFWKITVHVDSQTTITLLNNVEEPSHQHAEEIDTFRRLLLRNWEATISHIYREGNQVADYLAGLCHGLPRGTHTISTLDCNLCYYIRLDCMEVSEPRYIPN
ncbi:Putative ribonuclease H protein At1g65750, partial [Linum perenne]